MSGLSHFDKDGKAAMVDISAKDETVRTATARSEITMAPATLARISEGTAEKGDVLGIARVAGIQAAKKTSDLVPLCHPLALSKVSIDFALDETASTVAITATVKCTGKTGVEMEALTAATVSALTIYDMVKAVDKEMVIGPTFVASKEGGKSGTITFSGPAASSGPTASSGPKAR